MKILVVRDVSEVNETRRGAKRAHLTPTDPTAPTRWRVGDMVLVRTVKGPALAAGDEPTKLPRVKITAAELVPLESMTARDATLLIGDKKAKVVDLARWWMDRHDAEWRSKPKDYRDRLDSLVVLKRFRERWHPWQVWRIAWTLDPTDRPRFLPVDSSLGYIETAGRAMSGSLDPGEAVSETDQDVITAAARVRDSAGRRAEHEQRVAATRELAAQMDAVFAGNLTPKQRRAHRMAAHANAEAVRDLRAS